MPVEWRLELCPLWGALAVGRPARRRARPAHADDGCTAGAPPPMRGGRVPAAPLCKGPVTAAPAPPRPRSAPICGPGAHSPKAAARSGQWRPPRAWTGQRCRRGEKKSGAHLHTHPRGPRCGAAAGARGGCPRRAANACRRATRRGRGVAPWPAVAQAPLCTHRSVSAPPLRPAPPSCTLSRPAWSRCDRRLPVVGLTGCCLLWRGVVAARPPRPCPLRLLPPPVRRHRRRP